MDATSASAIDDEMDPRVARSRARLLKAATDILVEGGARAVTVDAVAERSGVAKSTMYRHFPSRTELLVEVFRANRPDFHVDIPDGDFESTLRAVMHEVVQSMRCVDSPRIMPTMIALKNTMPDIRDLTEHDRHAQLEVLTTLIDRGVAEGRLAPDTDPITTMYRLLGPLIVAVINDDMDRLGELGEQVVDQFLRNCPTADTT